MEGASEGRADVGRRRPARFAPTKFAIPASTGPVLARPALLHRLDGAREGSLRLVVGSPGSGKSTLLADWARRRPAGTVAWVSLDAADADPVRFWQAIIAAVQVVAPAFGEEAFDLLTLDGRVDQDALESLLIDADSLDEPLVLVIDDLHLAAREVADHLALLLARDLRSLAFALGSRSDLSGGLGRLRIEGRVVEVREVDLRLGLEEVGHLVRLLAGPGALGDDEVALLQDRTEGWAAGICLAVAAMGGDAGAGLLDRLAGSNQALAPYLSAELLDAQPDEVRRFLLDTCIVDELTPALAAELCPGSPITLDEVESRNLLLGRLDPAGAAFRYHHLFAELLRYRLHAEDPAREADLHLRAAGWFERRDPAAAFRHAWRAGHRGVAIDLVDGSVLAEYFAGRHHSVREVAPTLTDADLLEAGGRAAAVALALAFEGAVPEAVEFGTRLERVAGRRLGAADRVRLLAARSVAAVALGDVESSLTLADEAVVLIDAELPGNDWVDLAVAMAVRGRALLGQLDGLDAMASHLPSSAAPMVQVEQWSALALARLAQGRLDAAADAARVALERIADQVERSPDVATLPEAVLGLALLEQDHADAAAPSLRRALEVTSALRRPAEVVALLGLARVRQSEGAFDGALALLDRADAGLRSAPVGGRLHRLVAARRARVLGAAGRLEEAAAVLEVMPMGPERAVAAALVGLDPASRRELPAFAAEAVPSIDALEAELARLRSAIGAGLPASEVEALADRALGLAEATGALFPVIEAGSDVLAAVRAAGRRHRQTAFVERLARARPHVAASARASGTFPVDALSERERTVLRYLATAMSYREIADDLYVSINTVKTHVKNVIRKLQAGSRAEAVARARELGYL